MMKTVNSSQIKRWRGQFALFEEISNSFKTLVVVVACALMALPHSFSAKSFPLVSESFGVRRRVSSEKFFVNNFYVF